MKAVGKNVKKRLNREPFFKEQLKARRTGLRALRKTQPKETVDAIAKDTAINSWVNKGHALAINRAANMDKGVAASELAKHGSVKKMYREYAKSSHTMGNMSVSSMTRDTHPHGMLYASDGVKEPIGRRIREVPSKLSVRLRARVLQNQRKVKSGSTK
jgi:hypothetical protein